MEVCWCQSKGAGCSSHYVLKIYLTYVTIVTVCVRVCVCVVCGVCAHCVFSLDNWS